MKYHEVIKKYETPKFSAIDLMPVCLVCNESFSGHEEDRFCIDCEDSDLVVLLAGAKKLKTRIDKLIVGMDRISVDARGFILDGGKT